MFEDGEFIGGLEGIIIGNFRYMGFVFGLFNGFYFLFNNWKGFFLYVVVNVNGIMIFIFGFSGVVYKVVLMCFECFDGGGMMIIVVG